MRHIFNKTPPTEPYDADKRRIGKTVDSTTIKYFLDGSNVIADYDGDDVLLATYVTPGLDANLSQERGGSTYYYMADGLGSIRNLVDSTITKGRRRAPQRSASIRMGIGAKT